MECYFKNENAAALSYAFIAFMLPFLFNHPQWLVGTAVNTMLALAAYSLPWKRIMPIIFLPSIGALVSGLVFGPMSYFLAYMMPFIWAGNILFVLLIRKSFAFTAPIGKAALVFAAALLLFVYGVLPAPFLVAMGPMQLLTASGGLGAAYLIRRIYRPSWAQR